MTVGASPGPETLPRGRKQRLTHWTSETVYWREVAGPLHTIAILDEISTFNVRVHIHVHADVDLHTLSCHVMSTLRLCLFSC
jgi:hypothetical protein